MTSDLQKATELHNQGLLTEAEALYRAILAAKPDQPDALALLGVLLSGQQKHIEAIPLLERAVAQDPAAALFHFYLGNALAAKGDAAHAAQAFEKAVKINPDFGEAWLALSDVALQNKNYPQACDAGVQAVRLMPQNFAAHIAQGLALDLLGREEEAVVSFQRALAINPDYIGAWDMLGTTLQNLNRLDEAEKVMREALTRIGHVIADEKAREVDEQEYSIQHWHLALLELLRGDFRNGFAHYRARFKNPNRPPRLAFPQPIWRGEDLRGKKILLVGEQGFGDALMLCRYAPLIKAQGATVTLLAHQPLMKLLEQSDLADAYIHEAPTAQGDFDFQASLFDLPFRLGTTLETIPANPYLPCPAPDAASLLPTDHHPRIGIAYAGRPDYGNDRRRSIPLPDLIPLLCQTKTQFFSLTREQRPGDAEILAQHNVTDLAPRLDDFLTTAQFIAQLDLVITCDTAVAHLAGGMGKKVWLLLPFAPDWRWLIEREDSPWYPSMRLFRQYVKGDWAEVIMRVNAQLTADFKF